MLFMWLVVDIDRKRIPVVILQVILLRRIKNLRQCLVLDSQLQEHAHRISLMSR
jgi:hypothetical protein